MITDILNVLKKRWYIILIVGIICSVGLYVEKSHVSKPIPLMGDAIYIKVIKLDLPRGNFSNEPMSQPTDGLTYAVNSMININNFISLTSNNIDYEKFDKNWTDLTGTKKIDWIHSHFHFYYWGNNLYEIDLQLPSKDPKDSEYVKANADKLMDAYIKFAADTGKSFNGSGKYQIVDQIVKVDESPLATGNEVKIVLKYVIAGFVLGCIASSIVLILPLFVKTKK